MAKVIERWLPSYFSLTPSRVSREFQVALVSTNESLDPDLSLHSSGLEHYTRRARLRCRPIYREKRPITLGSGIGGGSGEVGPPARCRRLAAEFEWIHKGGT